MFLYCPDMFFHQSWSASRIGAFSRFCYAGHVFSRGLGRPVYRWRQYAECELPSPRMEPRSRPDNSTKVSSIMFPHPHKQAGKRSAARVWKVKLATLALLPLIAMPAAHAQSYRFGEINRTPPISSPMRWATSLVEGTRLPVQLERQWLSARS